VCRKNVILADCVCRQPIVSSDYTRHTEPPVTAMATRRLQQAMVPGEHLKSVHLLLKSTTGGGKEEEDDDDDEDAAGPSKTRQEYAALMASMASSEAASSPSVK